MAAPVHDADIIPADPRHRRVVVVAAVVAVLALILALRWGLPALLAGVQSGQYRQRWLCIGFVCVVGALVAPVLIAARMHARNGRRAQESAQFPPPGTRVLADTRVIRGARAVQLGKIQFGLGVLLGVCGVMLGGLAAYALWVLW